MLTMPLVERCVKLDNSLGLWQMITAYSYGRFTTATPLLGLHRSSDAEQTKTLLLLVYRVGRKK